LKAPPLITTPQVGANPVISPLVESQPIPGTTEYKTLTFTFDDTNRFVFRDDEIPYSWQEAYDDAIANGRRMPTKTELLDHLTSLGYTLASGAANSHTGLFATDIWCAVVAPEYSNGRDYIQIGTSSSHYVMR